MTLFVKISRAKNVKTGNSAAIEDRPYHPHQTQNRHPNIVQHIEVIATTSNIYFVMEYVRCGALCEFSKKFFRTIWIFRNFYIGIRKKFISISINWWKLRWINPKKYIYVSRLWWTHYISLKILRWLGEEKASNGFFK